MKKQLIPTSLQKALLQLDLTEKEIATYVSLLEIGKASVQDIFHNTGVNRVSIYVAIEELKQKGLVSESRKGKKKVFVAEDPEVLVNILKNRREQLRKQDESLQDTIVPMLKAINIQQENKPQIKFFEGADGINKVFDQYVLKSHDAFNCGSYETATRVISRESELHFFQNIKKQGVFYRMLLEDTPLNREFAKASRGIVHTKFLPEETPISADIIIFSDKVALISYEKETATLIEDESIARAIKMYLEFMWERL